MNTFTADGVLRESLTSLSGLTEVRAQDGQLLGYFSPTSRALAEVYTQAAASLDPDEKSRRKQSRQVGRTTDEVLSHLKSLDE